MDKKSLGKKGEAIAQEHLINNGYCSNQDTPHFSIDIIPRQDKDGLNLEWDMKPASEDELNTVKLMLSNLTKGIHIAKEKSKPIEIQKEPEEIKVVKGEIDYQVEQLNRMP